MDPFSPINGISLERYAELGAEVTDVHDPEECARIVGALGVPRADWEAAHHGWIERMKDMALMGRVAIAYQPLYQAALAKKRGSIDCSYEDFVAMSAANAAWGMDRMLSHYQIDSAGWTQLAGTWTGQRLGRDPRFNMYGMHVEQETNRLRQGGAPRPVQLQKSAGYTGGTGPSAPQTAAGREGYAAQQAENQMMAQAVQQGVGAHVAAAQAQAAAAYANVGQNAGFLGKLGMNVAGVGAIAQGIGPGMGVLVQWSDGNRYPATVRQVGNNQVQVAFGDGREMWVPTNFVTRQS